jgi:hypothetical protein
MNKVEFSRAAKVPFEKRYGSLQDSAEGIPRANRPPHGILPVTRTAQDRRRVAAD